MERRAHYHFEPLAQEQSWISRSATYRCPCCGDLQPCFQLRRDISGIPRRVDVTGVPCRDCLKGLGLDDLK